jgi:DNA-binding CsgD family transcriptional regulator
MNGDELGNRPDASDLVVDNPEIRRQLILRHAAEKEAEALRKELQIVKDALNTKGESMKAVLGQIYNEKKNIAANLRSNINRVLMPLLRKLESKTGPGEKVYIRLLRNGLKEITSPFVGLLENSYPGLTAREVEVCRLIHDGFASKEIAELLDCSLETIRSHRKSIRRKLSLNGSKERLSHYLKNV